MADFLDRLGAELARAATADTRPELRIEPPTAVGDGTAHRRVRVRRGTTVAFVALALLFVAAAGAATLVLRVGSSVPPAHRSSPAAGIGVPLRGDSRLLPIRVPDPNGGLPWGVRLVRTTRGLVCVQVGRIFDGQLGIIGVDGAFHDDGTFHPLQPAAIAGSSRAALIDEAAGDIGAAGSFAQCDPPAVAFTAFASGLTASGAMSNATVPEAQQRSISLGLLGPQAVSLTYRAGTRRQTIPVHAPLGVYLLVLRGSTPGIAGGETGGAFGRGLPVGDAPQPTGAVTAITYRIGSRTCINTTTAATSTCPRPAALPAQPTPRKLHERLHVRLSPGTAGPNVLLEFSAPYPVTSAASGYTVEQPTPCHSGTIVTQIERNIARGARVRANVGPAFANRCGKTITLKLLYQSSSQSTPLTTRTVVTIGQITVTAPAGAPPISRPRQHH